MALSSGYGDNKLTTWLNCSIFGKRGESLAPYLLKSAQVAISGEFAARPYTNKAGEEKLSLEVRVNDVTLLGKKDGVTSSAQRQDEKPNEQKAPIGNDPMDFEDDIPF